MKENNQQLTKSKPLLRNVSKLWTVVDGAVQYAKNQFQRNQQLEQENILLQEERDDTDKASQIAAKVDIT